MPTPTCPDSPPAISSSPEQAAGNCATPAAPIRVIILDCEHIQQAYVGLGDKTYALRRIVSENRLDPATTLYVGDMGHDIEAGHGAGLRTCAVLGGYTDAARLQAMQPGLVCHDLSELAALIRTHP